jgi:hypothetical protein
MTPRLLLALAKRTAAGVDDPRINGLRGLTGLSAFGGGREAAGPVEQRTA